MNRKWVALLTAAVMLGTVPGMQVWAEPEEKVEINKKDADTTIPAEAEEKKAEDAAAPAETKKDADTTVPAETEAEINGSVSSAEQLLQVAEAINNGKYDGNITLEKDIDLRTTDWPGIGNDKNQFKTTFDGQGHTVTLPGGAASLINYAIGATVKNVVVDSVAPIQATGYCGADCVGGVVAHMEGGSIKGCGNLATIKGDGENESQRQQSHVAYVGGIAGYVLADKQDNSKKSSISQCANMGAVSGIRCGGIAGELADGSTISDCSNSGAVTGNEMAAGIVAEVTEGKVQATLNTGTVDCDIANQKQPVIGHLETSNTFLNSYYDDKDWPGYFNGLRRTTKDLADGEVTGLTFDKGWILNKSFYPYQSVGGDRAKAQAAAAYVTEKEGTAYLNLSTEGSWTHNGAPLNFGNICTLKDGDTLTYSYKGYDKSISWSGGEKNARVMFGAPAPAEDSLTFTVKVDNTFVDPGRDGVYEIPYGSRVEIGLASEGVAVSTDTAVWEKMGLNLSGNGVTLSGTNIQKPAEKPVSADVYGSDPTEGTWKKGTLKLQSVKALPKVNGLDFPGSELKDGVATLTYSGSAIQVGIVLKKDQENLDVRNMSVRWYVGKVNLDNPEQNKPTGTAQGAKTEGGAPVYAGDYYADVVYDGNDYYLPLGMTKGSGCPVKIQQKSLTEAMFGTTDWNTPELLNQEEAKKPVTGTDGGRKLVEGRDYKLDYYNADTPGTCWVTITGQGNYRGQVEKSYRIAMGSYPVQLSPKESYVLGGGRPNVYWILKSQPTVKYRDGITFWVSDAGKYEFTEVTETEQ
ncbi:hypothetical protein ACTNCH_09810 [Candidatus Merdisoma sp. HCP28S3_D10]|uniref:hypothetical protein n=1 Tax=unclassified Candidatus Merdisoma TaxID=3099611 RepID=UPI003F8B4E38